MYLELSNIIDRAHPFIHFSLSLVLHRAVNSVIVSSATSCPILIIQIRIVELLIENASKSKSWVKFDPRWCKHEVDVTFQLVAPKLDDSSQVKLADHFVRLDKSIHVRLQAMFSVDRFLVELDLDKAIWISSNDEVDFGPVHHDDLLDIVHDVRQLSRRQTL